MQNCLSRFTALIPEFNSRPLTLDDFYLECAGRSIKVREEPLDLIFGCTKSDGELTVITLNSLIDDAGKTLTAFHELYHALIHPTKSEVLLSLGEYAPRDRWEKEAHSAALVALIPRRSLDLYTQAQLEELYEVPRQLAHFRLEIFRQYGL